MTIVNIFDAVLAGDYKAFKNFYDGNINCINKYTDLNLLQTVMCKEDKYDERIKIISYLIKEGIDVNKVGGKAKGNALHILYSSSNQVDENYLMSVTKELVSAGIDINQKDKYGAIPFSNLIAGKIDNKLVEKIFCYLYKTGLDCSIKDNYGNSCLDYAKKFSWRMDVVELMEKYENEN
ncbi:MAG: hypothetical protein IKS48_10605 [Eubacterium sp.]|nr:hypothetical protein [Eubacterium sp.]